MAIESPIKAESRWNENGELAAVAIRKGEGCEHRPKAELQLGRYCTTQRGRP